MFFSSLTVLMLPGAPSAAQAEHSVPVTNAINVIRAHHLDLPEGRVAFLENQTIPLTQRADALNREVLTLFSQVQDPANQARREELVKKLQARMVVLQSILPIMNNALSLNDDFEQIDEVLAKAPPIAENEEAMLLRVARICSYLDSIDLNAFANS